METIKLFAIGIILGVANVIPGVSGGTMAVVFGIYNRIIDLIFPISRFADGAFLILKSSSYNFS